MWSDKMKEPIVAVKALREAIVAINSGDCDAAEAKIDRVVVDILRENGLDELLLLESDKIPVCICIDNKGWSTCGAPCPLHPPIFQCDCDGGRCSVCIENGENCRKKVARGQRCVRCSNEITRSS
jgi:hypothetical protein